MSTTMSFISLLSAILFLLFSSPSLATPLSSHGCTTAMVMTACQYPGQSACSLDGTVIAQCRANSDTTTETRWAPRDSCYARQMKCGCVNGQAACVPLTPAEKEYDELK